MLTALEANVLSLVLSHTMGSLSRRAKSELNYNVSFWWIEKGKVGC